MTWLRRIMLVVLAGGTLGLAVPSSALAYPPPGPEIELDIKVLDEHIAEDSTLKNFSSWSTTTQGEIEGAMGFEEYLQHTYTGAPESALFGSEIDTTVRTTIEKAVENDAFALESADAALSDTGSTVASFGGEALDAATTSGIAPLALVPVLATLTYQDITTGTNSVYLALTGSKEDSEAAEYSAIHDGATFEDKVPEAMSWVPFPQLDPAYCEDHYGDFGSCTGRWENEHSYCFTGTNAGDKWIEYIDVPYYHVVENCRGEDARNRFGEEVAPRTHQPFPYGGGETPITDLPPHRFYVLEPKVEGQYYLGALAFPFGGVMFETGLYNIAPGSVRWFTPQAWLYAICGTECGHEVLSVVGYPPATQASAFLAYPKQRVGIHEGSEYGRQGISDIRNPERMHVGLPRHKTKAEIEKLEEEGRVTHSTGGTPSTAGEMAPPLNQGLHNEGRWKHLKQHVKHVYEPLNPRTPEPETPDPGMVNIPECTGSGSACKATLEALGLESVEIDRQTWEHAVVTKPAEAAIGTEPGAGSVVETTTTVKVLENPAPAGMPLVIPDVKPGELGTDYVPEVERRGFTKVEPETLPEGSPDPRVGPGAVSDVAPKPGSRVNPAEPGTPVKVKVNPVTAPTPGPGGGGVPCGLTPPKASLDTSPITKSRATSYFPFSLIPFLINGASGLVSSPQRPNAHFYVFGTNVGNLAFLSHFDTIFGIWRGIVAFFLTIAAAWFLWHRVMG